MNEVFHYTFPFILTIAIVALAVIVVIFIFLRFILHTNLIPLLKNVRRGKIEKISVRGYWYFFLKPLIKEIFSLGKSLQEARETASLEARMRQEHIESPWTEERLKEFAKESLRGKKLFLVSNRESYIHIKQNGGTTFYQPASGMVTALEPIIRACGGMWIAHGSGNADKITVDKSDHVLVPPDDPKYALRRVWLTQKEEKGYYYGFSNEGLWPLCHMAHVRPIFRKEDWEMYKIVNGKFAQVILQEIKDTVAPLVLIQDYHFALLPRMIKNSRKDALVGLFWHIPWPNTEIFAICPWRKELLDGMLGADLVGFHTQLHCNNFIDTVSHELEALIDRERFAVQRQEHVSFIKPFPISIPFEEKKEEPESVRILEKKAFLQKLGIRSTYIGLGVDRLDYTKGILERLEAVGYFLQKYPQFRGQFTFIQISAPTRSSIPHYSNFASQVEQKVKEINARFQTKDWKPVLFLYKHHTHQELNRFYKVADIGLVTSLHDGMNLVAKEYVMAKRDEKGVLVISKFAGAAQELKEAFVVNPYNIEEVAEALYNGLTLLQAEKIRRMRKLRETVRNFNVYKWSADLLKTLLNIA